ncbi:MAG: hypothetical protein ACK463_33220, partial [Bradyrhizobium sp.]
RLVGSPLKPDYPLGPDFSDAVNRVLMPLRNGTDRRSDHRTRAQGADRFGTVRRLAQVITN